MKDGGWNGWFPNDLVKGFGKGFDSMGVVGVESSYRDKLSGNCMCS